ncbi:hypothetical protein QN372_02360 [Undibacterium sp. RTI2.1]|nr:hypothetical protein [Undibacterium sp. RTI2.1]MEB0116051.1 hypothetical protein [Undibacterium sp. RTI2.2]MEB0230762.1 hypothetical protein [Undibacterium sp. 10I3]MEB0258759.1 hypothetical protein [Undibacterium sp. 5I1]
MLSQIITHTPLWVWAILGFLIYRGVIASKDRVVSLKSICIIPIVMLGLSLQGMLSNFGIRPLALVSWGLSYILVTALTWKLSKSTTVSVMRAESKVHLTGSWVPLALMMAIFMIKYCVNVMLAIDTHWKTESLFVIICCVLFGILNGVFMGKMLAIVQRYKEENAPTAQRSAQSLA